MAAEVAEEELCPGDVVVLATDGCFDALYPLEILQLTAQGLAEGHSAALVASSLCETAMAFSRDVSRSTPVVVALRKEGYVARATEMQDDVTVVVAIVQ